MRKCLYRGLAFFCDSWYIANVLVGRQPYSANS